MTHYRFWLGDIKAENELPSYDGDEEGAKTHAEWLASIAAALELDQQLSWYDTENDKMNWLMTGDYPPARVCAA
jgi:hypothetical protein